MGLNIPISKRLILLSVFVRRSDLKQLIKKRTDICHDRVARLIATVGCIGEIALFAFIA